MAGKGNIDNLKPWKPGQSGNPKGPKPGYKHLSTWIQDLMNDESFELFMQSADGQPYKTVKGAPIKAIVKTAVIKAAAGDPVSREWLAKYGYGFKNTVEVNNNPAREILEAMGLIKGDGDDRQIIDAPKDASDNETQV